ncbi:MAG: penicillin-binding protein 2 [Firmicutes bacterium]|mgnify:CR=1 FL=1|jgi:penicillin-binding protein 2|nr:penicillin-binding protein 2 [Clostridiaceae bacterium]NMB01276.1 penicillin-binding protein 2 [Bacillota bacterium]
MMQKDKKSEGLDRYIILATIIIVAAVAIIYNLAKIQLIDGQRYREESVYRLAARGEIYPKRGDIFDRNGVPIAGSRMGYCAQYVDIDMPNEEKNRILFEIIKVLEKDDKTVKSRLTNYINVNPTRFIVEDPESFIKSIVNNEEDIKYIIRAEQALKYMREKTFEIDDSYTDEEAFKIMQLRYEILLSHPNLSNPLVLADDISVEIMSELEERGGELRGVSTFIKPYREYYDNAEIISHVLGYVGVISSDELIRYNEELEAIEGSVPYSASDLVGKMGIESAAESILRGVKGETFREVDENGKTTVSYLERPAVPGQDVYLTIDLDLQRVTTESLERNIIRIRDEYKHRKNFGDANAGAVVVMDVNTGEILAMASYPDFDSRIFLENDVAAINELWSNPEAPVVNRATSGTYAPGSTYKPLIAVAALESGVIKPHTKVYAPYSEEIGGMIFTNPEGNQGYINLERALETSSNMFFYKVGVQTGIDNIVKWAKIFGFGRKTGIEIGEQIGSLASREYKRQNFGEDWYPANTAMASIGQLYNAFTPVQLVNYISTIANGGKKFTPHLIKMAVDEAGKITYESPREFEKLPIAEENIEGVKKGMVAVVNSIDGTAVNVFRDFPFDVAGKTGTSETGYEATSSSNGLFVCYAPYDKPEIAIAVVVEHGVWGSQTAPIARDIMMEYFRLNEKNETKVLESEVGSIEIIW